jgi:hypothetical protein
VQAHAYMWKHEANYCIYIETEQKDS